MSAMDVGSEDGAAAGEGGSEPPAPEVAKRSREVLAFYSADDHPNGYKYVLAPGPFTPQPLLGLSAAWLPGMVLESPDAAPAKADGEAALDEKESGEEERHLRVRFCGRFCDVYGGSIDGIEMLVPASLVREAGEAPRPLLSLLVVRWWDYWGTKWWSDYNVTSDSMVKDLVYGACGVRQMLKGEHEVLTVFLKRSEDLGLLNERWIRDTMRGEHHVAWYFLWPTARSPGHEMRAGCVCERDFFALCQRMERVGVRSGWPHPSQLYRVLCGKLWVPQMCLHRDYRVPPTTRVQVQEFVSSPAATAESAIQRLMVLQSLLWGEAQDGSAPDLATFRGVAKLGFSWQGKDVIPFVGAPALEKALHGLFGQEGSQQLGCLVQRMVPSVVCELRLLVFRDAKNGTFVWKKLYMRLFAEGRNISQGANVSGFALASAQAVQPDDAAAEFFGGAEESRLELEREADALVERWLAWFTAECSEPPTATRIDFIISAPPAAPGAEQAPRPALWTCEVGECGASLCGLAVDARNAAALNYALLHERASGRFPAPLPPLLMR